MLVGVAVLMSSFRGVKALVVLVTLRESLFAVPYCDTGPVGTGDSRKDTAVLDDEVDFLDEDMMPDGDWA